MEELHYVTLRDGFNATTAFLLPHGMDCKMPTSSFQCHHGVPAFFLAWAAAAQGQRFNATTAFLLLYPEIAFASFVPSFNATTAFLLQTPFPSKFLIRYSFNATTAFLLCRASMVTTFGRSVSMPPRRSCLFLTRMSLKMN